MNSLIRPYHNQDRQKPANSGTSEVRRQCKNRLKAGFGAPTREVVKHMGLEYAIERDRAIVPYPYFKKPFEKTRVTGIIMPVTGNARLSKKPVNHNHFLIDKNLRGSYTIFTLWEIIHKINIWQT